MFRKTMVLFLFLHFLFPHNASIPESSHYSENYAGIIASSLVVDRSINVVIDFTDTNVNF